MSNNKLQPTISVLLRRIDGPEHYNGINALLLDKKHGNSIYTASRDSTVKLWSFNNRKPPSLQASLEGHIDWVNDLALLSSSSNSNDNANDATLLATCSNDTTVRLWDTKSSPSSSPSHKCSIACLQGHSEYVMRLTSLPALSHQLVSGGLGGQVGVWDVSTGTAIISPHHTWSTTTSSSIYSLATDCSLIAAGLVDGLIALLDPRSGKKVGELRGHGDMVRALVSVGGSTNNSNNNNSSNSSLLSGSSDNTIKLWDLGTRRCIQSFVVHTDSVWALDVDPSGNVVYSGGKDGCVYRTQLSTRVSEVLVALDNNGDSEIIKGNSSQSPSSSTSASGLGITALAVTDDGKTLWTATASSSIQGWKINPSLPSSSSSSSSSSQLTISTGGAAVPVVGRTFTAGHHPAARARLTFASSSSPPPPVTGRQNNNTKPPLPPKATTISTTHHINHPAPQQVKPWIIIQGAPALKAAAVCTDKRHIITLDEEEKAQLWDVTTGCIVEEDLAEPLVNTTASDGHHYYHHIHHNSTDSTGDMTDVSGRPKRKDIKSYERHLFNPAHSIEPWFSFDTKLGCLALHLKPPQCFQAEVYAQELGQPNASSDLKINYGERMLKALFQPWMDGPQEQQQEEEAEEGKQMSDGDSKKDSDEEMTDAVINNTSTPSSLKGLGTAAAQKQGDKQGQQQPDNDDDDEGGGADTPVSSTSAHASSTATEPNQSSGFTLGSSTPKPIIIIVHPKQPPKTVASSPPTATQQGAQSSAVISNPPPPPPPPLRLPVDQLGNALSERDIPPWVLDCIISNTFPVSKDMKLTFHLVPAEGSNLPTLQQSKLNAPKVLTISKAADYVVKKLAEQGIKMKEEPLFWSATKQQQWFEMVGREQHGDNGVVSINDTVHHHHQQQQHQQQQQQSRHTNKASGKTKSSPLPSPTAMSVGIVGGLKNLYQKTSTAASLARQNSLGTTSGNGNGSGNSNSSSSGNNNSSGSTTPVLHLTCNGIVVPWDFSLAAVKKWIWKRPASEELRIEYSTRDPSSSGIAMRLPKINLPT